MRNFKFYVDMDEVLVDFESAFEKLTGYRSMPFERIFGKDSFNKEINSVKDFWLNLGLKERAKELWDVVKNYNPTLLTTPSGDTITCQTQKRQWAKENLNFYGTIRFSYHKADFADEASILIDDKKKNIREWIEAGGIGIRHSSIEETIFQLNRMGMYEGVQ